MRHGTILQCACCACDLSTCVFTQLHGDQLRALSHIHKSIQQQTADEFCYLIGAEYTGKETLVTGPHAIENTTTKPNLKFGKQRQ